MSDNSGIPQFNNGPLNTPYWRKPNVIPKLKVDELHYITGVSNNLDILISCLNKSINSFGQFPNVSILVNFNVCVNQLHFFMETEYLTIKKSYDILTNLNNNLTVYGKIDNNVILLDNIINNLKAKTSWKKDIVDDIAKLIDILKKLVEITEIK